LFKFFKRDKSARDSSGPQPSGPAGRRVPLQLFGGELDQETTLARELLDGRAIPYTYVEVTDDETTRHWLRKKTGSSSLPQLFLDEIPIGDYGALREIDYRGDLDKLLSGEIHPSALKREQADETPDASGRDADTIRERLRQGEMLGLTLPDGSSFDTWAEPYANPPQVYYEGTPHPIAELDRIVGQIVAHIEKGARFTWREDD
jgi:glutaredoxin